MVFVSDNEPLINKEEAWYKMIMINETPQMVIKILDLQGVHEMREAFSPEQLGGFKKMMQARTQPPKPEDSHIPFDQTHKVSWKESVEKFIEDGHMGGSGGTSFAKVLKEVLPILTTKSKKP